MVGVATILLIIVLERTRLKSFGIVVALIVASLLGALIRLGFGRPRLRHRRDPGFIAVADIALVIRVSGLNHPGPFIGPGWFGARRRREPELRQSLMETTPIPRAISLARGWPTLPPASSRACLLAGRCRPPPWFHSSGAKSRFANIFAGITIVVALLLFGDAIGALAMPALAGLLIVVGFGTLKIQTTLNLVWKTGNGAADHHGDHLRFHLAHTTAIRGSNWRRPGHSSSLFLTNRTKSSLRNGLSEKASFPLSKMPPRSCRRMRLLY